MSRIITQPFSSRPGLPPVEENPRNRPRSGRALHRSRSILLDLFPEAWQVSWGIQQLVIPAASPAVPAGMSAWYGIMDFDPVQFFGMEGAVAGAWWELLPTYHDDPTNVKWGNKFGQGAALVIDENLPVKLGEWTSGGCAVSHVSGNALAQNVGYTMAKSFPSGSYGDTVPVKYEGAQTLAGGIKRIPANKRVQLGFCLNRTQFNAANVAGGTIAIRATGYIVFWPAKINNPLTQV